MMNEHRASNVSSTGRRTQTKRKPRITPSAKLDLNGDQQYTTRNQILSSSHSLTITPIAASNITTSPAQVSRSRPSSYSDKDRAKSDDGFHSDSDKDSNHSNISIRQGKKYPVRSTSLNKLEPSVRIRTKTSSGSMTDNVKIGSNTNSVSGRSMTNDKSASEAKQERKVRHVATNLSEPKGFCDEFDGKDRNGESDMLAFRIMDLTLIICLFRMIDRGFRNIYQVSYENQCRVG